jgi:hypothetical protein
MSSNNNNTGSTLATVTRASLMQTKRNNGSVAPANEYKKAELDSGFDAIIRKYKLQPGDDFYFAVAEFLMEYGTSSANIGNGNAMFNFFTAQLELVEVSLGDFVSMIAECLGGVDASQVILARIGRHEAISKQLLGATGQLLTLQPTRREIFVQNYTAIKGTANAIRFFKDADRIASKALSGAVEIA